jgi:hypothetical protein
MHGSYAHSPTSRPSALRSTWKVAQLYLNILSIHADPRGRAVYGVGLRTLACWDYGFESRWGHSCLSLVSILCCQVEVSATGRSLVRRSPTECGVSECDL